MDQNIIWRWSNKLSQLLEGQSMTANPLPEAPNSTMKLATSVKCPTTYRIFCTSILGLPSDSWVVTRSEAAFKNLLLYDLDIDLATPLFLSFTFSVILLLRRNKLNIKNSLITIRVLAGTKNSHPVGFLR